MSEPKLGDSNFETAFLELVRQAVRTEVQELLRFVRDEDRPLVIDEVAQRLSVSKDWVYHNLKRLPFTKKRGPKLVRFSEAGLQKWLKKRGYQSSPTSSMPTPIGTISGSDRIAQLALTLQLDRLTSNQLAQTIYPMAGGTVLVHTKSPMQFYEKAPQPTFVSRVSLDQRSIP